MDRNHKRFLIKRHYFYILPSRINIGLKCGEFYVLIWLNAGRNMAATNVSFKYDMTGRERRM